MDKNESNYFMTFQVSPMHFLIRTLPNYKEPRTLKEKRRGVRLDLMLVFVCKYSP